MTSTDPALWTTEHKFGAAGGGRVVVLTQEGRERAFAVGARVRHGEPVRALMALVTAGGSAPIERREGSRMHLTELGRFALAWGYLTDLGLVSLTTGEARSVCLTAAGRIAAERGYAEQQNLLDRCRRAATSHDF